MKSCTIYMYVVSVPCIMCTMPLVLATTSDFDFQEIYTDKRVNAKSSINGTPHVLFSFFSCTNISCTFELYKY